MIGWREVFFLLQSAYLLQVNFVLKLWPSYKMHCGIACIARCGNMAFLEKKSVSVETLCM